MRVQGLILATVAMAALTATAFDASAQSSARETARSAVQTSPTPADRRSQTDFMTRYDPRTAEPRQRARWEAAKAFVTPTGGTGRPKYYVLEMFPDPSGNISST